MNRGYLLMDALISIVLVSLITLLAYAINDIKLNYNLEYDYYDDMQDVVIDEYRDINRCQIAGLS